MFQLKQCSPSNWSKTGSLPGVSMTTFIGTVYSFHSSCSFMYQTVWIHKEQMERGINLLRCVWRGPAEFNTSREGDQLYLTTVI